MARAKQKNIIVFVHKVHDYMIRSVREYEKARGTKLRIALLTDLRHPSKDIHPEASALVDFDWSCDTYSPQAIQKLLRPFEEEILAVTSRGDDGIPLLSRVIPHMPYLKTPTTESLLWATDKVWMRRRLTIYNKKITPSYTLVQDLSRASVEKIETKVGYTAIIKPAGIAASRLVTIVYYREGLKKNLTRTFRSIKGVYKEHDGRWEPKVLVEQFMEGDMYSVDCHVNSRGTIYFCPPVMVKTGRQIGFDDFFGYMQMTPSGLSKTSTQALESVATEAIHALALRSTSVHVELMKTEKGWKIIELGPRVGGFRQEMYKLAYGINLSMNDIQVRIPEKLQVPKKVLGYTVAMKFFAKKEGRLTNLIGIKKAESLKSFYKISVHKKIGDICRYAKNGGSSVFNIILFNKDRSKLLADIHRLEEMVKIETGKGE